MLRGFFDTRTVVGNLIIINILAFLLTSFIGADILKFAGLYLPYSSEFKPFQLFTHVFLHADFWHLFFNMFALGMFGINLERTWGPKRFLIFYLVTAFGAAFIHLLVNVFQYQDLINHMSNESIQTVFNEGLNALRNGQNFIDPNMAKLNLLLNIPTVGASGAVFGILLGFGMLFPNTELLIYFMFPIKAKYLVIGYGLLELFRGFQNSPTDNVAHFAHLGGMLFAFILIKIWERNRNQFY